MVGGEYGAGSVKDSSSCASRPMLIDGLPGDAEC